jgi:hypothetical protein
MRLPEIRTRLLAIADDLAEVGMIDTARTLKALAEGTRRRPAARRSAPKMAMTDEARARVLETATRHPDWSLHQIGVECGVNQGRVSEIVAGFRE